MLEILKFVFSSFWVWSGTCLLLIFTLSVFCGFIGFLAEAFKPKPLPPKPLVPRSSDN